MIEIKVIIKTLVYPRNGAENDFKIYGAVPKDNDDINFHDLKFNQYDNLTLKGIMPKLEVGAEYSVKLTEVNDKNFGVGYTVESVHQDIPASIDDQKAYLTTILTELQVKAIYDVYEGEDVLQMFKDDKFDYSKVKGFGETTYHNIRNKILSNIEMQEALVALSKYGLTYKIVSNLVKRYGSARMVVQKIEENPYVLTEVDGLGFKKVDSYALKMGIEEESEYRVEACVRYILEEQSNNNGHSWILKSSLIKEASGLMKIDESHVSDYIDNQSESKNNNLYIDDKRIGMKHLYKYEKSIYEGINEIQSYKPLRVENIDEKISKAQEKQGFEFTDEQRGAIEKVVNNNVSVITGKAGTGKTTILKGVIEVLGKGNYYTCALSGKASQRIAESTGLDASTMHRMLGFDAQNGFAYDRESPLPYDVVVLDEASMVNSYLFSCLIDAIKRGGKIIIIGDIEQLEPIGAGNVLKDMILSGKVPTAYLTKVHRQAMKSGILSIANEIREGKQFLDKDEFGRHILGELKDLHVNAYKKQESVKKSILKSCRMYLESPEFDLMNFQVIVPLKKRGEISTQKLNIELQQIFNPEMKPVLKRGIYEFKEGDKVIQQGNNYDEMVFNGTLGMVTEINTEKKEITIDFVGVGNVTYTQENMSQIDMAYALTVHRVQGSQFENVIIGLDYSSYVLLSRQLVYTALTRASKLCIMAVEVDALRHSIRTDKSSKRNTFLSEMLKK